MFDPHSLTDTPALYWNSTGAEQSAYNTLYGQLVPSSGMCETVEGELLRLASKIYYRHYNDGDVFTPASFDFLRQHIGGFTSYDEMVDKTVRYVLARDGVYTPNEFDSVAESEIDESHLPDDDDDKPYYEDDDNGPSY
jgi:hypothetical protein